MLIANGANINPDSNHISPLLGAVSGQNWPLAKLLIAKGAKANVVMQTETPGLGDQGITPLHYAVAFNNIEVVRLLIAHQAPINAKTNDGMTPLHLAIRGGHDEIADLLRQHGAQFN